MFRKNVLYKCISLTEAKVVVKSKRAVFVDIRDELSFSKSHIPDAIHLTQKNLDSFLSDRKKDDHIIVYCYHGNSSKDAAEFLTKQGFQKVYSLDGGFSEYVQSETELQNNNEAREVL